ncbi:MAG: putative toxin [Pyrinomonadaceae bacterium]
MTNQNGEIVSRRDFLPFGKELPNSSTPGHSNSLRTSAAGYGSDNIRQKFTGYQKDEETDLDFAEARMYENRHGRFTAVDPLLASGKSAYPQTFNRFVYVYNNPTNTNDPSGMCPPEGCEDHDGRVYEDPDNPRHFTGKKCEKCTEFIGATNVTENGITYVVWNDGSGNSGSGGWRRLEPKDEDVRDNPIRQMLLGFKDGIESIKSGSAKGAANFLIQSANALQFVAINTGAQSYFITPRYIAQYEYNNGREARWGTAVNAGLMVGSIVVGGSSASAGGSIEGLGISGIRTAGSETATIAKTANQIGMEGEVAVKNAYDIGSKIKIRVNGRNRIPDGINDFAVSEVKNVERLSYTRQLKDYADYAGDTGRSFDLYVRKNTNLSGPLQVARDQGFLNIIRFLP